MLHRVSHLDPHLLKELGIDGSVIQVKQLIMYKWYRPAMGRAKLNSDGCSTGNPGPRGGGRILRSPEGK